MKRDHAHRCRAAGRGGGVRVAGNRFPRIGTVVRRGAAGEAEAKACSETKLPALRVGSEVPQALDIGVKCDFPPFGFIDVRGNNDGYDVQVARRSRSSPSAARRRSASHA